MIFFFFCLARIFASSMIEQFLYHLQGQPGGMIHIPKFSCNECLFPNSLLRQLVKVLNSMQIVSICRTEVLQTAACKTVDAVTATCLKIRMQFVCSL